MPTYFNQYSYLDDPMDQDLGYFETDPSAAWEGDDPKPFGGSRATAQAMQALTAPKPPTIKTERLSAYANMAPMPKRPKPKWWGVALAGLYGGLAGYTGRPVDTRAVEGFSTPGYGRDVENWRLEAENLRRQAELERLENDAAIRGYTAQNQAQIAEARVRAEEARQALYDKQAAAAGRGKWNVTGGVKINDVTGQVETLPPAQPSYKRPGYAYPSPDESGKYETFEGPEPTPKRGNIPWWVPEGKESEYAGRMAEAEIAAKNRSNRPRAAGERTPAQIQRELRSIVVNKNSAYSKAETEFAAEVARINKRYDALTKNAKGAAKEKLQQDWASEKKAARSRLNNAKNQIEQAHAQERFVAGIQETAEPSVQYDPTGESWEPIAPPSPELTQAAPGKVVTRAELKAVADRKYGGNIAQAEADARAEGYLIQ